MPENDPGDGEINDVEEFMREFDNIERDETLIELVGEGYDVNAPGDQAVADFLGAWRDDVRQVPVDESRLPSAHTADGRMPPAPTTGGTLSIGEGVGRLRQLAGETYVQGALQEAAQQLESARNTALNALGEGASQSDGADLMNTATEAAGQVAAALAAVQGFYDMCGQVAGRHS